MLMTDMKENQTEDERIERIVEKIVKKKLLEYDRTIEDRFKLVVGALTFLITVFWINYRPDLDYNFFEISWIAFMIGLILGLYTHPFLWLTRKKDIYHRY